MLDASMTTTTAQAQNETPNEPITNELNKYKNVLQTYTSTTNELQYSMVEKLLENEKIHNKTEPWNKLDKTVKIQKLHKFAEKYGKDNTLPAKEVKTLKAFFVTCLEQNKLQKAKDIVYDKETKDIISIPALHFNQTNRNFTLKVTDPKRVSTLKSLTPKRMTEKNQDSIDT
jgi:hypothetical protein